MNCSKCQSPIQPGAKRCSSCGYEKASALAITSYFVLSVGGLGTLIGLGTSVSASSAPVDPSNQFGSSLGNALNFVFGIAIAVIGGVILLVGGILFLIDKNRKRS